MGAPYKPNPAPRRAVDTHGGLLAAVDVRHGCNNNNCGSPPSRARLRAAITIAPAARPAATTATSAISNSTLV